MDSATTLALRQLYRVLLSAVVLLARVLGEPSPLATRAERRMRQAIEEGGFAPDG